MGKVVHFEIPTDDLARAKAFYESVFDWSLETMPMPDGEYTSVMTTPVDEKTMMPTEPGAINGGMMQRTAETPNPVIVVGVADISAALDKVGANGGTVVHPRTEIPGMGAYAYFRDTDDNVMGLWEDAQA